MPLSMLEKLGGVKIHQEQMNLMVDGMVKAPYAIVEDVMVKMDKFIFSVGFVILDNKEDPFSKLQGPSSSVSRHFSEIKVI